MWEDLIQSESKGKRSAEDLSWFPDTHIKMPAYVHSGDDHWDATRQDAKPDAVPTSSSRYLALSATENNGVLLLQARKSSPNDSTNLAEHSIKWISPYRQFQPSREATAAQAHLYDCWTSKLIGNEHAHISGPPAVDAYFWDHLGAGSTTQLALMLWSANMWMQREKTPEFCILPVRTQFNSETAKLRAARVLLNHLVSLYGSLQSETKAANEMRWNGKLLAVTSMHTLSAVDPANNMVRNTISAVASLCGGADVLAIQPWNVFEMGYSDPEAALLSENLYHLLIDEGRLGDVADPLSGSYFIESLTGKMVEAAWTLFLRLKDESIESIQALLRDELFPEDRKFFREGESESGVRQVIGETLYVDAERTEVARSASAFPLIDPFDFEPRISPEVAL
ncbi:hypothetical protein HQ496_08420 [bacterium]|nr:hypothetical protein [bacterium]